MHMVFFNFFYYFYITVHYTYINWDKGHEGPIHDQIWGHKLKIDRGDYGSAWL